MSFSLHAHLTTFSTNSVLLKLLFGRRSKRIYDKSVSPTNIEQKQFDELQPNKLRYLGLVNYVGLPSAVPSKIITYHSTSSVASLPKDPLNIRAYNTHECECVSDGVEFEVQQRPNERTRRF